MCSVFEEYVVHVYITNMLPFFGAVSDRVGQMGKELFRLTGNGGLNFCLAPVS